MYGASRPPTPPLISGVGPLSEAPILLLKMSDQEVEPAAPAAKAAVESTEKATPKDVSGPSHVPALAKKIDHTILRLNK